MILILGGAWQGKSAYAAEHFGVKTFADFPAPQADGQTHLEQFSLRCTRAGLDPVAEAERLRPDWEHAVLISREIGSGVVPMDAEARLWRENHGRLLQYLAQHAQQVIRIFCGLPEVLK